jgi:hypothetical protein
MADRKRQHSTDKDLAATAPHGASDSSKATAAAAPQAAPVASAEAATSDLPAAGSTTKAEKSAKPKDGEGAHNEVTNPNARAGTQADEDRFEMLTNSAGLTKGQVVTRTQVVESHAGVTVESWLKRGIIKRTNEPATPVQQ